MLAFSQLNPHEQTTEIWIKIDKFSFNKIDYWLFVLGIHW